MLLQLYSTTVMVLVPHADYHKKMKDTKWQHSGAIAGCKDKEIISSFNITSLQPQCTLFTLGFREFPSQ